MTERKYSTSSVDLRSSPRNNETLKLTSKELVRLQTLSLLFFNATAAEVRRSSIRLPQSSPCCEGLINPFDE